MSGSHHVVPGPVTSTSPGNLLDMQILGHHPTHTEIHLGGGPAVCV